MTDQSASAAAPADQYVLTLSCPDKQGIVHAVSSYLFMTGCNIEDSQQFGDHDTGLFFMRVHFSAEAPVTVEKLRASFAAVGDSFHMDWQIHRADQKMRILLMVSKFGHCLNDLLFRARTGALPVEIVGVVSNHTDFEELVGSYNIPFHHIPVTKDTKSEAEAKLLELVREQRVELVVLARYMQVLSDDLCKPLVPAELQGREAVPPGARAGREADRRDGALRHRGPGRGADHRAGGRARRARCDAGPAGGHRPRRGVPGAGTGRQVARRAAHPAQRPPDRGVRLNPGVPGGPHGCSGTVK
jgi:predicted amino acid-binding ACT domain protein